MPGKGWAARFCSRLACSSSSAAGNAASIREHRCKHVARDLGGLVVEGAEDDVLGLRFRMGCDCLDRDLGGFTNGVPIDAGRDRGKRDRASAEAGRKLERTAVAAREQRGLVLGSAVPDRAYGVNDVLRGQAIALGHLRV